MRLDRMGIDAQPNVEARMTKEEEQIHASRKQSNPRLPATDTGRNVTGLANRTIGNRLRRVARLLPRAAKKPEEDVEYVHDLRVSVRRATAALQMFALFLPPTGYSQMIAQLRRIRGAAGRARDLDVLEERLCRLAVAGGATPSLVAAIDRIRRSRQKAQKPLLKAYEKTLQRDFKRRIRDLSGRVRWRGHGPEPNLDDWAGAALAPALDRFAARCAGDLSDIRELHRMRIAEKRVRYSLEILEGAAGSTAHRSAPILKELQERLGQINDHQTARALLSRWRDKSKSEDLREVFSYLAAFEKQCCDDAHDRFLEWWTSDRKSTLHAQIDSILAGVGGGQRASAEKAGPAFNLTAIK